MGYIVTTPQNETTLWGIEHGAPMTDIATLKITLDASDIDHATQALGRLTVAANEAKAALLRLGASPEPAVCPGESLGQAVARSCQQTLEREQRPGGMLSSESASAPRP